MELNGSYTTKGLALAAKLLTGTSLSITKVTAGSGQTAVSATVLAQEKQTLAANSPVRKGSTVTIPATLAAAQVTTGYTLTEVGVYARDPSEGEILYRVYRLDTPVSITAGSGLVLRLYLAETVSGTGEVAVTCSPAGLLVEEDLEPVQSRVMMVTVPAETVTLSPADLPAYLAGLPRLLIRELKITLTAGTCTEAVRFNRFYGPGTISVTGAANAASLLTGGLEVKECSVEITLKQLAISGKLTGNSTFAVNTAPYVLLQDSTVNGGAEGYGVSAYEGANVALLRVTLSNCAYAVLAGYSSTVSVADCTCSENTTGAYVFNGGIVLIDDKTSPTLGGSTHKHTGGIVAKGDGTLL